MILQGINAYFSRFLALFRRKFPALVEPAGRVHIYKPPTERSDTVWHRPLENQLALRSHFCVALSSKLVR
jgi:hypothetical protein